MKISARIFLGYFCLIGIASWVMFDMIFDEIKPAVRQTTEDTLVDTANFLAEIVKEDVKHHRIQQSNFAQASQEFVARRLNANIWGLAKTKADHRIYITNAQGIVIFDSTGKDIGTDYSQWRDVALTLKGKYGARSTPTNKQDPQSSIMYVAAPIIDQGNIIGVLTVSKPNRSSQPFIERAQGKVLRWGLFLLAASLAVGLFFAVWMSRSLRKLSAYANKVSQGQRAAAPSIRGGGEVAILAQALEAMRKKLEGREYVENYVQTLTHEMKSPLAAIKGAAELIEPAMPADTQAKFINNINEQTQRLQDIIERMLVLAVVEHRQTLEAPRAIALASLVQGVLDARASILHKNAIALRFAIPLEAQVYGEPFLLQQAIGNIVDNALDFMPVSAQLHISAIEEEQQYWQLGIINQGPTIPDYALSRICERFYSLPRPNGKKSTGLGLAFVSEVMSLHGGTLHISNHQQADLAGVSVLMTLPKA